mmetsp:Transcript_46741/g.91970  ORF Transcript_46741/g.91970 Transcript_46741/m.91970 type:complete len:320 (-) Transcript_46741:246-1205(-)
MDAPCADADLCPEPEPVAVGKARRDVVKHAGGIYPLQKSIGGCLVFCHDHICVSTAVPVDVLHRSTHASHHLYRASQLAVLRFERLRRRDREDLCCPRPAEHTHIGLSQSSQQARAPPVAHQRLVQQQCLHSVAGSWVIGFCVLHHVDSFVQVGRRVYVSVAYSFCVAHHWYLGVVLYVRHQLPRTTGDDEVNHLVQFQQLGYIVSALYQTHQVVPLYSAIGSLCDGRCNDRVEETVASLRLLPTFQYEPVAAPNSQSHNLWQAIGPGLKNDHQHPDRHSHLLQSKPFGYLRLPDNFADRFFIVCDGPDTVSQSGDLLG